MKMRNELGPIRAKYTTESVNRKGFRLNTSGEDNTLYQANPQLLSNHDRNLNIGRGVTLGDGVVDMYFDGDDKYAVKIYNKVKAGYLKTLSAGLAFNKKDIVLGADNIPTVMKWELREISVVTVPADTDARIELSDEKVSILNYKNESLADENGNVLIRIDLTDGIITNKKEQMKDLLKQLSVDNEESLVEKFNEFKLSSETLTSANEELTIKVSENDAIVDALNVKLTDKDNTVTELGAKVNELVAQLKDYADQAIELFVNDTVSSNENPYTEKDKPFLMKLALVQIHP